MKLDVSFVKDLGIEAENSGVFTGEWLRDSNSPAIDSYTPITGEKIGTVYGATDEMYERIVQKSQEAHRVWRNVPAPKRGELVRQIGLELRKYKEQLGNMVALEMGKIAAEGAGEVQEMIDMADLAVGQSRQLYGPTIASERENHRMYEQWHPLGVVGIITSFNFPVAPWAWNAFNALVCGDSIIWKPSSETALTAVAVQNLVNRVITREGFPEGLCTLAVGSGSVVGQRLLEDKRVALISFTGSIPVGRKVAENVARRLGRSLLELGGNNAIIISEKADLDIALRAVLFAAVGTAGQRCTTTRRLIIHESIYDTFVQRLINAYKQVQIGNPLEEGTVVGPLINKEAVQAMMQALEEVQKQGGRILYGGQKLEGEDYASGCYVTPCIAEADNSLDIVQEETFAPILYVMKYKELPQALAMHNDVPQGLSSAIFSNNLLEVENFLGPAGSDCGIANVNTGTSGAEIGGAFGGEKDTGSSRETGSDAWKNYMRRQTATINWGTSLPLAQGIKFGDF